MMSETEARKFVEEYNLELDLVNYGIAARIKDTVILNKNLLKYPDLANEILDHEVRHSSTFTKKDFFMDLTEGSFVKNFMFSVKHPLAFTQFIPVGKYKGDIWIDFNLILVYTVFIILVAIWGFIFL